MTAVRQYELIYITPPDLTDEAQGELYSQVTTVVERFGGTVEKADPTVFGGRRKLAYEIAGQREGHYVLATIKGPAQLVAELERRLRVFDNVIRHMVVRVDEDLERAERARTRRKESMVARRVRRGLPPEPTEDEKRRGDDDDDLDGGMETGFREGSER